MGEIDWITFGKVVGTIVSIVVLAVFTRSGLLRRVSGDGVVMAQNKTETDMLTRAMAQAEVERQRADAERERADEANKQLNAAMVELGGLRAQVEIMKERIAILMAAIEKFERQYDTTGRLGGSLVD
jgi:hypothetical protein